MILNQRKLDFESYCESYVDYEINNFESLRIASRYFERFFRNVNVIFVEIKYKIII